MSSDEPPVYVFNTVSGDNSADALANYWGLKTRTALEILRGSRTLVNMDRMCDLFEHMLVLACSLVKNSGWKDENEYRLIYITKKFGDENLRLPKRPDGNGRYVSLRWTKGRAPIRAIVPHPLADPAFVEKSLRRIAGDNEFVLQQSELRPRPS